MAIETNPELEKQLAETRDMLDSRYDDIKNGNVKLIPGDEAFARLHARIDARRNPA